MINSLKNPWDSIHNSSTRRVDPAHRFDIFWLVNEYGKYGLTINLPSLSRSYEFIDRLKGVSIIKRLDKDFAGEIYLILKRTEDWEIFLSLCLDLIQIGSKCENIETLVGRLNGRLKRWQFFLSNENNVSMPLQKQMGLLAELIILRDYLIPTIQVKQGLESWVGPDFNKQDFALADAFLEVKSFITTKGAIIKISSLHQLVALRPLFLIAFGFTINEHGFSILDLINSIDKLISEDDFDSRNLFENKLAECGFIEGITSEPFYKFNQDVVEAYNVIEEFPRILPINVQSQILTVEYSIDLLRCSQFKVQLDSIF